MSNTALASLTLSALVTLHNDAIDAYGAPDGMKAVGGFKSKSAAIERIEKLCEHGNLAVMFDGDSAVIVDATPIADELFADEIDADETPTGDDADADDDAAVAPVVVLGDAKGAIAPSGFIRASDVWLKGHARGTSEREAYRKARRHAARMARKAAKAAREAV